MFPYLPACAIMHDVGFACSKGVGSAKEQGVRHCHVQSMALCMSMLMPDTVEVERRYCVLEYFTQC